MSTVRAAEQRRYKHARPSEPSPRPAQGDHLLNVLNTLESRAVVLEAELREVDDDIAQNAIWARKYGEVTMADGSARLAHMRVSASPCTAPEQHGHSCSTPAQQPNRRCAMCAYREANCPAVPY